MVENDITAAHNGKKVVYVSECLEGAELDLIMACDGKKFMVQVKSSYYTKRGKSKSDTEQYTKRRFAHFGNKKNADYSKMIVVCIYMHSFEPFQLKQKGEYDVSNKRKEMKFMQHWPLVDIARGNIIDPPQVHRQAEYVYNVGQEIIRFKSTQWIRKTELLPAFSAVEWLRGYPASHWYCGDSLTKVITRAWVRVESNIP